MLFALLGAALGLLEFKSSMLVWAWHLHFQVAVFTIFMTLLSARLCLPNTCLSGRACTFQLVVSPLGMPSFGPICGGLHGQTKSTCVVWRALL